MLLHMKEEKNMKKNIKNKDNVYLQLLNHIILEH